MATLRRVNVNLPPDELVSPGHRGCAGCGVALALRLTLKALGPRTVLVATEGCWSSIDGPWPHGAARVPLMHAPVGAAAAAAGVRAALELHGRGADTAVCVWADENASAELLSALAAAVERGERIRYVLCDSQSYSHPAARRGGGPAANRGAIEAESEDIAIRVARAGVAYAATATIAFPEDLVAKVTRARNAPGVSFVHILAPCPPAWQIRPAHTVRAARMAVAARVFPLFEIDADGRPRLTHDLPLLALEDYLSEQGRFRPQLGAPGALQAARSVVERRWRRLAAGEADATP